LNFRPFDITQGRPRPAIPPEADKRRVNFVETKHGYLPIAVEGKLKVIRLMNSRFDRGLKGKLKIKDKNDPDEIATAIRLYFVSTRQAGQAYKNAKINADELG
jgi:hypothetical protein